jgi:hypothetical protein
VLHEETNGEALITTGVGQHQMWAAQWYKLKEPRQWATSGGLGSMGFGLPSALGAAVAYDGTDKGRPKRVRPNCWSENRVKASGRGRMEAVVSSAADSEFIRQCRAP